MSGMVVWVTGLSGSGKTTLCRSLYQLLKPDLPELVLLDGDILRAAFGHDLGYTEGDRVIQVRRVQGLAKALSDQGLIVFVAVLYAHPELLRWNRRHIAEYFEVYLEASLETVWQRDSKQLYARAVSGLEKNMVGIDIPWHAPESPDLVINADHPEPPEVLARRVAEAVPQLARVLGASRR